MIDLEARVVQLEHEMKTLKSIVEEHFQAFRKTAVSLEKDSGVTYALAYTRDSARKRVFIGNFVTDAWSLPAVSRNDGAVILKLTPGEPRLLVMMECVKGTWRDVPREEWL
jgi:hypothetical protein